MKSDIKEGEESNFMRPGTVPELQFPKTQNYSALPWTGGITAPQCKGLWELLSSTPKEEQRDVMRRGHSALQG